MHPMLRHPMRFRHDHRFTLDHASEHLDGELDPPGRERVEEHARFCPRCRELLASLRQTVVALGELRAEPPPADADLSARVIARWRAER